MKVSELNALSAEEKKAWVLTATRNSTDDEPICCVLAFDQDRFDEWLEYPEDYEIGGEIRKLDPTLADAREIELNSGHEPNEKELSILKDALFEQQLEDMHSGNNYMCRSVQCEDGILLAVFVGRIEMSIDWSFYDLFNSKEECVSVLQSKLDSDERLFLI
jgi:hypothetical protein